MRHLAFLLAGISCSHISFAAEAPWKPLFNGKDLSGWETYLNKPFHEWDVPGLKRDANGKYLEPIGRNSDPLKVFTVGTVDGQPAIHVSGQGFGTLTTSESFANYHLRLQVKWGEKRWANRADAPRDSGLLYFVHGEPGFRHEMWPRSVEFQIQERDFGDLFAIATQITVPARTEIQTSGKPMNIYDPEGLPTLFVEKSQIGNCCRRLKDAEKPKGEWNSLDLICLNGNSIHVVNGQVVMRLLNAQRIEGTDAAPLISGTISLQSEGAEVFYRNLEIRPIHEIPAEFAEP